jgi:hypothetical protein
MREYQVRFCERLGVKSPGPTRQTETDHGFSVTAASPQMTGHLHARLRQFDWCAFPHL